MALSGAGRNVSEMRSIDAVEARGLGGAKRPRIKDSPQKGRRKSAGLFAERARIVNQVQHPS